MSGSNSGIPLWFYNWRHYFHALLICRQKKLGQKRNAELRIALWFSGIDIPGGPPRNDLAAEFARAIKTLLRPIHSTYEPTCDGNEKPNRAARLLKQLGEQAPIFKGTILELSSEQILSGYKEGRYCESQKALRDYENNTLGQIADEFGLKADSIPEINWPPGLMAHPADGENAGVTLIQSATDAELNIVRSIYRAFLRLPDFVDVLDAIGLGGNLKATREISAPIPMLKESVRAIPAWRLFLLVNFLAYQKQEPELAKSAGNANLSHIINALARHL
jgi:hypothetical protein